MAILVNWDDIGWVQFPGIVDYERVLGSSGSVFFSFSQFFNESISPSICIHSVMVDPPN